MRYKKYNLNRREFFKAAGFGAASLALMNSAHAQTQKNDKARDLLLYVGTYTSGKSEGIYIYKFNQTSGELKHHKTVKGVVEPSYLAIDPTGRFLYAVNETAEFQGKKSGAVSAFAINAKNGDLQFLNQQPSLGGAPCYVTASRDGKFVLVANYLGGNVSVFPVQTGGKLGAAVDLEQHNGSSVNLKRQEAAHAHFITLDKNNRFAFACDLGADKIYIYRFDAKNGKLTPAAEPFFKAKPGAGPRHLAFHPKEKFAFVINELDMTITAFAFDPESGSLKEVHTVSTLPANWSGANTCADIHVSPDGKFLYGSNRGHDSIVSYLIDQKTGKLDYIEHVSTGGKTPRNFVIDPTGNFLLAANQNSDKVVVLRIDTLTGRLTPTNFSAEIPTPVCLKFMKLV